MNKFKFIALMVFVILGNKLSAMECMQFAASQNLEDGKIGSSGFFRSEEYKWLINNLKSEGCRCLVSKCVINAGLGHLGGHWSALPDAEKEFFYKVFQFHSDVLFDSEVIAAFTKIYMSWTMAIPMADLTNNLAKYRQKIANNKYMNELEKCEFTGFLFQLIMILCDLFKETKPLIDQKICVK